jgi:hypothetical protein
MMTCRARWTSGRMRTAETTAETGVTPGTHGQTGMVGPGLPGVIQAGVIQAGVIQAGVIQAGVIQAGVSQAAVSRCAMTAATPGRTPGQTGAGPAVARASESHCPPCAPGRAAPSVTATETGLAPSGTNSPTWTTGRSSHLTSRLRRPLSPLASRPGLTAPSRAGRQTPARAVMTGQAIAPSKPTAPSEPTEPTAPRGPTAPSEPTAPRQPSCHLGHRVSTSPTSRPHQAGAVRAVIAAMALVARAMSSAVPRRVGQPPASRSRPCSPADQAGRPTTRASFRR